MVLSNQNWCRCDKTQRLSSRGVSNNVKRPSLLLFAAVIGHCLHCINANKAVKFSYVYFSFLQNIGSNNFTRLYSSPFTQGNAQNAYIICWYRCTADPLRRQSIKVRSHQRYIQSKKNWFCMQFCKPRYFSTTDKNYKRFRSKMNILSTIL